MSYERFRCKCSACGGWGVVLGQQRTKDGHMVDVAYACVCEAAKVNYPSLPLSPRDR